MIFSLWLNNYLKIKAFVQQIIRQNWASSFDNSKYFDHLF